MEHAATLGQPNLLCLTCMFFDGGKKPQHPEQTHADMGRTCKLHTKRSYPSQGKPRTLLVLDGQIWIRTQELLAVRQQCHVTTKPLCCPVHTSSQWCCQSGTIVTLKRPSPKPGLTDSVWYCFKKRSGTGVEQTDKLWTEKDRILSVHRFNHLIHNRKEEL